MWFFPDFCCIEIALVTGVSRGTILSHYKTLTKKNLIRRILPQKYRTETLGWSLLHQDLENEDDDDNATNKSNQQQTTKNAENSITENGKNGEEEDTEFVDLDL